MENQKLNKEEQLEKKFTQYLTYLVGNELYGFEVSNIREVIEYNEKSNITRIPLVPEYIRGVINLRGEVIPVIDLSSRFYDYKCEITRRTCIAVIELEDENEIVLVGAMFDAVNAVIDFTDDDIEKTLEFGAKIRADFIYGIGKADNTFIILLNLQKVLDVEELSSFKGSNKDVSSVLLST